MCDTGRMVGWGLEYDRFNRGPLRGVYRMLRNLLLSFPGFHDKPDFLHVVANFDLQDTDSALGVRHLFQILPSKF